MLWPSPAAPTLTLPTGVSTLTLPVRSPATDPLLPITQATGADPAPAYAPMSPDASGRLIITHTSPAAPYKIDDANITLSSSREETSEITRGDPLSAHWRQTTRSSWTRDNWACAVEASYDLTCDANTFHLTETLRATHNGDEIFTRTDTTSIARDLM